MTAPCAESVMDKAADREDREILLSDLGLGVRELREE
jgi:uncharacterized metal-binding protein